MTIIKHQTSPDGYQCRLVRLKEAPRGRWEILYDGQWSPLCDVAAQFPGWTGESLSHRCRLGEPIFPSSIKYVGRMVFGFWLRRKDGSIFCETLTASQWANEWAKMRRVNATNQFRTAFIRHLAGELEHNPKDHEGALKRTLKGFAWTARQLNRKTA